MDPTLERYLAELRELKAKLLPPLEGDLGALAYRCLHRPHASGGGDYFDALRLPSVEPVFGVMVADVSGHGPGAAMEAAMLDAILRTHTIDVMHGPAAVLDYVNRYLFSRQLRGAFITACLVDYRVAERTLAYVCAGHPPPLAVWTDGSTEPLPTSAQIPLCVDPDAAFANDLAAADMRYLVLYTDGVTDLKNAAGERLGEARLREAISAACRWHAAIDTAFTALCAAIDAFAASGPAGDTDDLTLMLVELAA